MGALKTHIFQFEKYWKITLWGKLIFKNKIFKSLKIYKLDTTEEKYILFRNFFTSGVFFQKFKFDVFFTAPFFTLCGSYNTHVKKVPKTKK